MNFGNTDWRPRRSFLNQGMHFYPMQYPILNYSTEAQIDKKYPIENLTLSEGSLLEKLKSIPDPLKKNLADTVTTTEENNAKNKKMSLEVNEFFYETESLNNDMGTKETPPKSEFYPSLTGITGFFTNFFGAISGAMFQRRAKSPASQYYDCFDGATDDGRRAQQSWQTSKIQDQNKNKTPGEQFSSSDGSMNNCRVAAVHCESKLSAVKSLLTNKTVPTTPKIRQRRPRRVFVEPNSVEENYEDAFAPDEYISVENEEYVEFFTVPRKCDNNLSEIDAPKTKVEIAPENTEIVKEVTNIVDNGLQVTNIIGNRPEKPSEETLFVPESTEVVKTLTEDCMSYVETENKEHKNTNAIVDSIDSKQEIISSCEDKIAKLKSLLQGKKKKPMRDELNSTVSVLEPFKEDTKPIKPSKTIPIEKIQDKHFKNPHRLSVDKRKKCRLKKNIQDDILFASEIDSDDISSVENSPKSLSMERLKSSEESLSETPDDSFKEKEYFDEVKGRFHSSSTTDSEDSFQIVFTDTPKLSRIRRPSDCDSEDSFIVFEDSPDSCYMSHEVFGEESNESGNESDSELSDSGLDVCKLSHSLSRTVSDLTDNSLYEETETNNGCDELDCAVRTVCEEISPQEIVEVKSEESLVTEETAEERRRGLLLDEARKLKKKNEPPKKVTFSSAPPTVRVMRVWAFAARQARAGHWERFSRDRERFKRRIADVDMAVSWVLKPQHRRRVMFQRFMPWWNQQKRKEAEERKRREAEEKERKEREEKERIEREEMERIQREKEEKEDMERLERELREERKQADRERMERRLQEKMLEREQERLMIEEQERQQRLFEEQERQQRLIEEQEKEEKIKGKIKNDKQNTQQQKEKNPQQRKKLDRGKIDKFQLQEEQEQSQKEKVAQSRIKKDNMEAKNKIEEVEIQKETKTLTQIEEDKDEKIEIESKTQSDNLKHEISNIEKANVLETQSNETGVKQESETKTETEAKEKFDEHIQTLSKDIETRKVKDDIEEKSEKKQKLEVVEPSSVESDHDVEDLQKTTKIQHKQPKDLKKESQEVKETNLLQKKDFNKDEQRTAKNKQDEKNGDLNIQKKIEVGAIQLDSVKYESVNVNTVKNDLDFKVNNVKQENVKNIANSSNTPSDSKLLNHITNNNVEKSTVGSENSNEIIGTEKSQIDIVHARSKDTIASNLNVTINNIEHEHTHIDNKLSDIKLSVNDNFDNSKVLGSKVTLSKQDKTHRVENTHISKSPIDISINSTQSTNNKDNKTVEPSSSKINKVTITNEDKTQKAAEINHSVPLPLASNNSNKLDSKLSVNNTKNNRKSSDLNNTNNNSKLSHSKVTVINKVDKTITDKNSSASKVTVDSKNNVEALGSNVSVKNNTKNTPKSKEHMNEIKPTESVPNNVDKAQISNEMNSNVSIVSNKDTINTDVARKAIKQTNSEVIKNNLDAGDRSSQSDTKQNKNKDQAKLGKTEGTQNSIKDKNINKVGNEDSLKPKTNNKIANNKNDFIKERRNKRINKKLMFLREQLAEMQQDLDAVKESVSGT